MQDVIDEYREADVRIVAASSDDREGAEEMKEDEGLDFPVLHGLDVDDVSERYGLYVQRAERTHLQPAQFIVRPDATIRLATYSSGKVGRLDAAEALDVVESSRG